METKFISFDVKADADQRKIAGYGSVFGNVDRGGDVVVSGAFQKSISSGRKAKMLFQHDPDRVIGVWQAVTEDDIGLKIEGVLADTALGNEVYELLKIGAIDGLSIGYRVIRDEWKDGVRYILEAELWEVSVVTFPMNEEATIDAVKAATMSKRELEKTLRDAGFSRLVAKQLIAGGYDAIGNQSDSDSEISSEIFELLKSWK